jgi:hypothetical protein
MALPVARLGVLVAASNGAKRLDTIEDQLNPYGDLLYQQQAAEEIRPAIARTFLALAKENKVPMWVVSMMDLKLMTAAAAQ